MDKFEYKVRAQEIRDLIAQGDYVQAAEIADTIDWRRVKSVMMLCTISDLYKINRRYEDAKDLLLLAYEHRPGGRNICYSLCELSIKTGEFVQATEYYKEFVQAAPKDPGKYILQYKLYEDQDVSLEERIAVLEELKKHDYREKWAYELAYLYHRVGLAARCVEECDEMILWFGEGEYVIKAMELKMLHQPLSPEQQEKYDLRFEAHPEEPDPSELSGGQYGEDGGYFGSEYEEDPEQGALYGQDETGDDTRIYEPARVNPEMRNAWRGQSGADNPQESGEDELDIQVKTVDVGQYNTMNLQAELAQGLQELLSAEQEAGGIEHPVTRSIVAPMMHTEGSAEKSAEESMEESKEEPTEFSVEEVVKEAVAEDLAQEIPEAESEEDISQEAGEEIPQDIVEEASGEDALREMEKGASGRDISEESAEEASGEDISEESAEEVSAEDASQEIPAEEPEDSEVFFGETGEIVLEQMRLQELEKSAVQSAAQDPEPVLPPSGAVRQVVYPAQSPERKMAEVEPPRELANVLSQEPDGQISLVVPEWEKVEKQITGQMAISDVLAEWERMKKENEEKRKEEVRQHVLQQTGNMFADFDEAVKNGLLEQLEKTAGQPESAQTVPDIREDLQETPEGEMREESGEILAEASKEPETDAEESGFSVQEEESEYAGEADADVQETEDAEETGADVQEPEYAGEAEAEEPDAADSAGAAEETDQETGKEADDSADGRQEEAIAAEETPEEEREEHTEKGKVRSMTREERELYGPYIQSRSTKEQIVKAVDNISLAAYTGNVIITGEPGMDTVSLAKNIIREVQATDSNFSGKVAKISGKGLNGKNVEDTLNQLQNGALIIQSACDMEEHTIQDLYKTLQKESLGIVVLIQDETRVMNRFLKKHKMILDVFTARVDVEALSNDLLVAYGRKYAKEQEYSIDELGVLALHNRIEQRQTIDHAVTTSEVKEIVDGAIRHANRKTPGHFFDILLAKRYDEEDMIVVTEKDFA